MTTEINKNATKADLLELITSLQKQLAAATASQQSGGADAGKIEELTKQLADASAEAAASRNRVDELIAQLAEANAERGKLSALLETAHRDLHKHSAAPPSAPPASASEIVGPAIVVRTRQGREQARYRAGRTFTREDDTIALSDLSEEQLDAIRKDRELVVTDRNNPTQET